MRQYVDGIQTHCERRKKFPQKQYKMTTLENLSAGII